MAVAGSAIANGNGNGNGNGKLEEPDHSSSNWYFSREDIEKRSPSRLDGIDLKKETYFRKSYCTFLQDLGMCLKVPQVTIATAIVFSHRFFLRQSHLKNDRHMVATICMFLAGKVEETPRPLRDVILISYEIRYKKDPVLVGKIKLKDTYEEQKELVLVGERLVLTTLGFDLNIAHPYKPLVAAIKKLKVAQNALAQVAWNFVNDGLRTSLCLQFKPHHIAAGAIFLAAKFLKVKLPQDGEKVWWQEFEVTPRQLEEVSNQMLELYEQNKTLAPALANGSRSNDPGASSLTGVNRAKGGEAVPSADGHQWAYTASTPAALDKTDKLALGAVKAEDANSIRRDDVHDFPASGAPPFTHVKLENGRLGTDSEPIHENGSAPYAPDTAVDNKRPLKPATNAQVKLVKEEAKEHVNAGSVFEDGQIKAADFRVKTEPGTTLRKPKIKAEFEDRKVHGDSAYAREATEARSSLEDRDFEDVVDSKAGAEVPAEPVKVKVESEDAEPKKFITTIEDVNIDRVNILRAQKRRKSKGEGLDSKPTAVNLELTDEEELERVIEGDVQAAADAERVKQERREVKVKSAPKGEYASGKKDGAEDGDTGSKRRRFSEEETVSERKWSKSSERSDRLDGPDPDLDRSRAGPSDRAEDGELPSSSHAHDKGRSPRQSDRRPAAAGPHDKGGSPASLKRHRDQHGRSRDGHRDSRVGHNSSRDRDYHQRDIHHRTDGDRDRHHYNKERDYQDRDHKKSRVHELHGN